MVQLLRLSAAGRCLPQLLWLSGKYKWQHNRCDFTTLLTADEFFPEVASFQFLPSCFSFSNWPPRFPGTVGNHRVLQKPNKWPSPSQTTKMKLWFSSFSSSRILITSGSFIVTSSCLHCAVTFSQSHSLVVVEQKEAARVCVMFWTLLCLLRSKNTTLLRRHEARCVYMASADVGSSRWRFSAAALTLAGPATRSGLKWPLRWESHNPALADMQTTVVAVWEQEFGLTDRILHFCGEQSQTKNQREKFLLSQ